MNCQYIRIEITHSVLDPLLVPPIMSRTSPSRRDAGFTIRLNDGKNKSLYFIMILLQNRLHIK